MESSLLVSRSNFDASPAEQSPQREKHPEADRFVCVLLGYPSNLRERGDDGGPVVTASEFYLEEPGVN